MLEARLLGYVYNLDQKKGKTKILVQKDTYVIQQVSDRFAGMEDVASWGQLEDGCYFLIRTPLESIRESVSISKQFLFICRNCDHCHQWNSDLDRYQKNHQTYQ